MIENSEYVLVGVGGGGWVGVVVWVQGDVLSHCLLNVLSLALTCFLHISGQQSVTVAFLSVCVCVFVCVWGGLHTPSLSCALLFVTPYWRMRGAGWSEGLGPSNGLAARRYSRPLVRLGSFLVGLSFFISVLTFPIAFTRPCVSLQSLSSLHP